MNPNYLTKEELLYELGIRGIKDDSDTQYLRKLFRRIISRDLPLQWDFLASFRTEELYSCVSTKIYELQEWLTREGLSRNEISLRAGTRVQHLRGRLRHLTQAGLCTTSSELSCSDALHKQLDSIEQLATSMLNETPTQESNSGQLGSEMEQGSASAGASTPSHVLQASQNIMDVRSDNTTHSPIYNFQEFQKLPNPVSYLLKELPIIDGNDARLLCDFLLKIIHISTLGQIKEPMLFQLLYPYCRGELLACLGQAIASHESFDVLHERLLRRFIPRRQLSQLRMEYYDRVQGEAESLDQYVRAIKDAATALLIKEDESDVVARIVEGLNPSQRARLVFQAPPSTFLQLEQLGTVDRNITFADNTRKASAAPPAANAGSQRHQRPFNKQQQFTVNKSSKSGNQVVCFHCGKPGHIQSNCFLRSSSKPKGFMAAKTHS